MPIIHTPVELSVSIRNQRKKLKLSQTEVGELVGLKQKTISALENTPENVKLSTLFRVISALELEIKMTSKKESDNTTKQWVDEW
jgi:HTH-type transcriptional regulator/antitoxin HipB